jgi:hypothetical protein
MIENIKPKEATSIINSLIGGVVPKIGVQHITVGRSEEIEAFVNALNDVKNGHSMVKFWIGDFGAGKSFILHLLNTVALKQKFVVTNADFTPDNRLYSNDGKATALYLRAVPYRLYSKNGLSRSLLVPLRKTISHCPKSE